MTERLTLQQLKLMRPEAEDAADCARIEREYALGMRIRELRAKRSWSPADLARRSGVPIEAVEQVELGSLDGRLTELQMICVALQAELELRILAS